MGQCICFTCKNRLREKIGPHEYIHYCEKHLALFAVYENECAEYDPVALTEPRPVYFTGAKNNQVRHDFMVRPVGDLVEINGAQFTAEDAEKLARAVLAITMNREVSACPS